MPDLIPRRLRYHDGGETRFLPQMELVGLGMPVVVLAEAGMGKSRLLEWLASQPGHAGCTARQLINRHDPRTLLGDAETLVIDALDEVASIREGDAVDLVLRKLGELGYPRFVLSCRVADWRSATSVAAIGEQYSSPPVELHLEPFTEPDTLAFLTEAVGASRADEVVEHFNRYGLRGFLGNPQTLEMIGRVASHGPLPHTSSELFERTVEVVWKEHRDAKADWQPTRDQALEAAGAAFAGLLMTGSEAISRRGAANTGGDLPLPEVEDFDGGRVWMVVGTRLFKALDADRFSYWHRRIGEYLAARWLSGRADTRRKRLRLLAMFHADGLVPTSLRGVHAWLALDRDLATSVIEADPMGVIQYGDADALTADQARAMLAALHRLGAQNPGFRNRGPYRARGLVQAALLPEVRRVLAATDTPQGLQLLLLEQLEHADMAFALHDDLLSLVGDPTRTFAERWTAAVALHDVVKPGSWSEVVEGLRQLADTDSTRIAVRTIEDVGFDHFDDQQITDVILAHSRFSVSSVVKGRRERVIGTFTRFKRDLPPDRSAAVLDLIGEYTVGPVNPDHSPGDELTDLILELIARTVIAGGVSAERLWAWLMLVRDGRGYDHRVRATLDSVLSADLALRRAVQRLVLLQIEAPGGVRRRCHRLGRRCSALSPDENDLVAIMRLLDPNDRNDMRWRELLELCRHGGDDGVALRNAARPFAAHRQDLLDWIDRLADPAAGEWERRKQRERRRAKARKASEMAEDRAYFRAHARDMRNGGFEYLANPAKAYLRRRSDTSEELPAHRRIADWLGDELAETALAGFETFLVKRPVEPNAAQIAHGIADGYVWGAGSIIVAALAERRRSGRGYADLPFERIAAGWFELRHREDEHAGIPGLRETLADELRRRGRWRTAHVLLIEPQLRASRSYVENLHELMRSGIDEDMATDLSLGWLRRFQDLPAEPERECMARAMSSARRVELAAVARTRLARSGLSDERRRSWTAAWFIVDPDAAIEHVSMGPIDRELLWNLRGLLGVSRHDGRKPRSELSPGQLGWIVHTFRRLYPATSHPGSSEGSSNAWDATDFIHWAIGRLGEDVGSAATAILAELRTFADGYLDYVLIVSAEQRHKLVETRYLPPSLNAVAGALNDRPPTNAADLQAMLEDALELTQARLKGDPLDWYRGFYAEGGAHKNEEACRDELLKMLDGRLAGVEMRPESHFADDRRVDIECSLASTTMVPVEIKGQWHKALWTAADDQLDKLYAADWRSERRGIYLILWFGALANLTKPPTGIDPPETPAELRAAVAANSKACGTGMVKVVVLDLTRQ